MARPDDSQLIDKGWDSVPGKQPSSPQHASVELDSDDVTVSTAPGEWLVNVAEEIVLSMSKVEVLDALRSGRITSRSLIWRAGMQEWARIEQVPQLRPASSPAPLPSAPLPSVVIRDAPSPATPALRRAAPAPLPARSAPRHAAPSARHATPAPAPLPAPPTARTSTPPRSSSSTSPPPASSPAPNTALLRRSTLPFGFPAPADAASVRRPSGLELSATRTPAGPVPHPSVAPSAPIVVNAAPEADALAIYERPVASLTFADSARGDWAGADAEPQPAPEPARADALRTQPPRERAAALRTEPPRSRGATPRTEPPRAEPPRTAPPPATAARSVAAAATATATPPSLAPTTTDAHMARSPAARASWDDESAISASELLAVKAWWKRAVLLASVGSAAVASLLTLLIVSSLSPSRSPNASAAGAPSALVAKPEAPPPAALPSAPAPEAAAAASSVPAPEALEAANEAAPPKPKPRRARPVAAAAPRAASPGKSEQNPYGVQLEDSEPAAEPKAKPASEPAPQAESGITDAPSPEPKWQGAPGF